MIQNSKNTSFSWFINRFAKMSCFEVLYRLRLKTNSKIDKYFSLHRERHFASISCLDKDKFFLISRHISPNDLQEYLDLTNHSLLSLADKYLCNQYNVFGSTNINFGEAIDWDLDPKTDKHSFF